MKNDETLVKLATYGALRAVVTMFDRGDTPEKIYDRLTKEVALLEPLVPQELMDSLEKITEKHGR